MNQVSRRDQIGLKAAKDAEKKKQLEAAKQAKAKKKLAKKGDEDTVPEPKTRKARASADTSAPPSEPKPKKKKPAVEQTNGNTADEEYHGYYGWEEWGEGPWDGTAPSHEEAYGVVDHDAEQGEAATAKPKKTKLKPDGQPALKSTKTSKQKECDRKNEDVEEPESKPDEAPAAVKKTFARRKCPTTVKGQIKWNAAQAVFMKKIYPRVWSPSTHEDCSPGFLLRKLSNSQVGFPT